MLEIELHNRDSNGDPPASFATDAEIEIANRLLHQIEARYFGPSAHDPASHGGAPKCP